MTEDLYKVLGIGSKARRMEIRRAYRNRAKRAHPDAGGSSQEFALVKLAHDVLTDAERRAHYDATGEAQARPIDNRQAMIMETLSVGLDLAMAKLYDEGLPPREVDMLARTQSALRTKRNELQANVNEFTKNAARTKELLGRFQTKADAPNVMEQLIVGRLAAISANVTNLTAQIERIDAALLVLADFRFRQDAPSFDHRKRTMEAVLGQGFAQAFRMG